jgi:hypothetical protein
MIFALAIFSQLLHPLDANANVDITFENLFKNRKSISQVAWSKFTSKSAAKNQAGIPVMVYVGPNTKPLYKTPKIAVAQVTQAFSQYQPPKKVTFIQYQYTDMKWAQNTLRKLITSEQLQHFTRNEGGQLFESNCESGRKNCFGAKALTATSGEAFILQGVMNELPVGRGDKTRMTTGMLEAHEYFHTLQDVPIVGQGLARDKFPPNWLTEGSAELVQNLAVNKASYKNYIAFIKEDSNGLYGNYIYRDPEYISKYLDFGNNRNYWEDYPSDMSYSLGSRICEILVAVKGPNSLLDMNYEMGSGVGFEKAFVKVYGKSWSQVQPIIARTLAANIKDYL